VAATAPVSQTSTIGYRNLTEKRPNASKNRIIVEHLEDGSQGAPAGARRHHPMMLEIPQPPPGTRPGRAPRADHGPARHGVVRIELGSKTGAEVLSALYDPPPGLIGLDRPGLPPD
jgi:hypothetical protein